MHPARLLPSLRSCALLTAGGAMLALLTGCGAGVSSAVAPVQIVTGSRAAGSVMGGQQPVAGVTLRLYQTSTAGYGQSSTPLGGVFPTTQSGNFNLPSFSCTSGTQLFLVGTGGTPIGGSPNASLALMTGLGSCSNFNPGNFININELTTVAAVYALAPFMSSPTSIGAPATNQLGLGNAMAVINQVVNSTNGTLPGPALPTGATLPSALLNTLADILQSCVNSAGGTANDTSTACGSLFSLTTVPGSPAPIDTITAMLNIAHNPTQNVAALNGPTLRPASPVFTPTLSVNNPPPAWTVAITYAPAGIGSPSAVAADAAGNIWFTNSGNSSVSKLDYSGAQTFNVATGYSSPKGIAIDPNGDAWISNSGNNTLSKQPAAGGTPTAYSGNGLASPTTVSVDGAGNVFVTNTNSLSSFTNTGAVLYPPYTGVSAPVAAVPTPR